MEVVEIVLLVIMGLLILVTFPMIGIVPTLWLKREREGLLGVLILALTLTAFVLILLSRR